MGVDSLGYIVLNVAKLDAWRQLLERVFGMEPRARGPGGAIDYRMDNYHHRFTLCPSDSDGVLAVGWEVGSVEKLEALVQSLRDRKVEAGAHELRVVWLDGSEYRTGLEVTAATQQTKVVRPQ